MEKIKNRNEWSPSQFFSKFSILLLVMMLPISFAFAQQSKTIKGKVTDSSMSALPGATVIVKGASTGAITTANGTYEISVPVTAKTLIYSFIGMKSVEISISNQSVINVKLEEESVGIDELVVVGYGSQKKATLTGSVTQVSGDDMIKSKGSSSAALSLQGEVPGLTVTRNSSRPGNEEISIKIRGDISVNSIQPLILLDGLEIPLAQLSTINANDIDTYSVLKDAAAAIYGTKAAGGVILITTKKGVKGKLKVNYNGNYQINQPYSFPLTNLKEFAQVWLTAAGNDNITYLDATGAEKSATGTYRFFTKDEFQSFVDGTMPMSPDTYFFNTKTHRFADVSQFDAVYGNTVTQRHDLSVSGGNDQATFRTSIGYSDDRSPIAYVYDGAKKYNFRTNLNYKINDILSTEFLVSYDNRLVDSPTQGVGTGLQDPNIFPLFNPQGQYYDVFGANNVLALLDEGGRTKNAEQIFRLGGKITLDLNKYVKGLSFNYNGNFSSDINNNTARKTSVTMYDWDGNISSTPTTLLTSNVTVNQKFVSFQNHALQANYLRTFHNHNLGLLLGVTAENTQSNQYNMYRSNMADDMLDDLNTGDVTTQTNGGKYAGSSAVSLMSYIGKINYDYKGIYLLEALGRRDGSSRLHPDYRWKNFYGASTGIRISELSVIKNLGVFDNLKLRGSYGETGSVTGIGEYDYISTINTGSAYFGSTPAVANTSWIGAMTSTDRSWERVGTTNIAIDFSVLNNRLSGTGEYYIRKNNDMLVSITYPQVLGATAPKTNSGDFTTNGWELSLNWRDKVGSVKYNIGLSAWDSRSEVTRMEGKNATILGLNAIIQGKPLNALYTYQTNGVLQTEADVLDYYNAYGFVNPADQNTMKAGTLLPKYRSADRLIPGNLNRVDVSGPDGVPDGIISTDDLVYQGDANPHNSFGVNLGFEWKGLDFSAFFQGVGQQNIIRTGTLAYPIAVWYRIQNSAFLGNTWTVDNPDAPYPAYYSNATRNSWNYKTNDINVVHATYVRAKVLSLGYSLPKLVLDKMNVERIRFSVTGNDLFVISNVLDKLDPEMGASANQGNSVPYNSTILFGVEVTF